jgi:hypothetical protein
VPGRNFENLSTSGGKPWEVMFQGGQVGLGYSSGIYVDRPFNVGRDPLPENVEVGSPLRVNVPIKGGAQSLSPVGSRIRHEVGAAGQFVAAYLLKEGLLALETGDPKKMAQAVSALKEPGFWGNLAVFTGAARLAELGVSRLPLKGFVRGFSRMAVPLAVGMAAVNLISGNASLQDILVDTGSFLAAGLAVNLLADTLVYPALFAAGPPGWVAAGAYTIGKLALTLYAGEKLSDWLKSRGVENLKPRSTQRKGAVQKVGDVSNKAGE